MMVKSREIRKMMLWAVLLPLAAVLPVLSSSCSKAMYADENEVQLTFSADTLSFDTVFTTVATPTRMLVVYNRR